ncbi:Protein LpfC [Shigella boydii]|uniref:Protein LpfC n=1 Tax=Shigella dysenteriae TaxID=622 RepID=A0A3P6L5C2_SHIDY|nr:type 1 fimbriae anchoring protein FimD [Shigella dysenteriae CDC 74-1112]EGD4597727.1 fimbrial protein FimD [Shigella dysenteriae]EIQ55896.1 lpfC [Shigella dysenteriae 225-75]VDG86899.1 protein LpfC [Shigella dysenteriae]
MMTTRIVVGLTAGTCLIFSQNLMAEVSVFNPALLEIDHQSGVDIRQFNRANLMPPGVYSVDIFINGKMFERQDVTFVQNNPDADLHACFIAIKKTLSSFGIKVDALMMWMRRFASILLHVLKAHPGSLTVINCS